MTRRARPTVTRDRDDQRRRRGGAGPRPSGRGRPSPVKVVRTRALHLDRGGTARSGRTCVTGRPAPRTDHDSDRPGRAKQWTPQAVMPRRLGPEIIRYRSGTNSRPQAPTGNVKCRQPPRWSSRRSVLFGAIDQPSGCMGSNPLNSTRLRAPLPLRRAATCRCVSLRWPWCSVLPGRYGAAVDQAIQIS